MVTGGNASHYWEASGIIGEYYQTVLGLDVYAWDIWMIYKPGVLWNGKLPPAPDFWMHQLGIDDGQGQPLDSEVFAGEVERLLDNIKQ